MKKAETGLPPDEGGQDAVPAASQIDAKIASLADWRGQTLAAVRALIHQADPDVVEEVKWRGACCRPGWR